MEERTGAATLSSLGDMSNIGSRTFVDGSVSQYFTLAGEEYIRKLPMGNGWNYLRVSVLCGIQGNSTFALAHGGCGFCSSGGQSLANIQGARSNSTVLWYGGDSAGTITYNSGPPAYWAAPAIYCSTKVGSTWTPAGGNNLFYFDVAGNGYRSFMSYSYSKPTSASYVLSNTVAMMSLNLGMSDMMENAANVRVSYSTAYLRGSSQGGGTTQTMSGESSPLDCISIYWSSTTNPLEVYGIAVYGSYQLGSSD